MNPQPLIAQLHQHIQSFTGLLHGVDEPKARWKPSPQEWSILEVLNHLCDEESEDFRSRLELTLQDPSLPWPPIDPPSWAIERAYNTRDPIESLQRFVLQRQRSVKWLRGLENPNWENLHHHPKGFTVRAGDLLVSWVAHDLLHLRQLSRLHYQHLGQSTAYSPEYAGPWT